MDWKLAEAKNKFSEVINKVLLEGPARVTPRRSLCDFRGKRISETHREAAIFKRISSCERTILG